MPTDDLIPVKCPCCPGLLYLNAPRMGPGGGPAVPLTQEPPKILRDAKGHYLNCRHCSRRIAMLEAPEFPGGFSVSPDQNCT